MSDRTISGQLAALNAGIVGYLDGLPRDVNSILDRDAELSRWVTSIATDLGSLFDDIAVTWSPAEAEFLRNRIHETSRTIQSTSGVMSIFPQTAGSIRVNVNPLQRLIKGMIAKANGQGGVGADKCAANKPGRPKGSKKSDALGRFVKKAAKRLEGNEGSRIPVKQLIDEYKKESGYSVGYETLRNRMRDALGRR